MDVSVLIPKMIVFVVLMVIGYLCAKPALPVRSSPRMPVKWSSMFL